MTDPEPSDRTTLTDLAPAGQAGWRRPVSARARILGWTLLLVGLALATAVGATWTVLLIQFDRRVDTELADEVRILRSYAAGTPAAPETPTGSGQAPVAPSPAQRSADVAQFLAGYLTTNVPDRYETFFSLVDGRAAHRSRPEPPARLDTDAALVTRLAQATAPTAGWAQSTAGRVRYAVLPVRVSGDPRPGALVVVEFYDLQRAEVTGPVQVFASTALAALAIAGLGGWLVAGRVLAPIRLIRQTAERISGSSDLTRRLEVTGNDDVAALAQTFNRMLDRLERAFTAQRQFLDDTGHELRTPLTVIRGHLEVMGTDPAEREETIALVMDELGRMHRIVEDLLLLAKAEQPDFLHLGEVELADLTMSVVAKARPLGERRWRVGRVAEERVLADGQRLTQALMQLVANAVRHTREGDTIEVGSAVRDGRVRLWVRDTGPGVPAADRERVFERFVRVADGARPGEGAGLGLPIVRSIAQAHGGGAHVVDAPGGGATFVLTLPLHLAGDTLAGDTLAGDTEELGVPELGAPQ